ncbi:hypothetical protein SPRG_16522 [Saprolegnia parasitica CBS 223.65]|uniref:AB hydrolase-1 domain-containing protein n=1 Tax=Saprolegnia parasitica (strain CBS 223.65) TaxID=695850 RepID=A0A067BTZ9_SAPPC|nr:hypothetical protein SPRG_16522 [Saprolegnia parasitica CBS 223.65]KDO18107.1 hypothetical protein SPRG_16522 [Saprolegnia parasitica CBS 223.65]|eukprot:XP_012211188.1 hypothetical protein SPRG_16522 [Saprolegnia parasitica CBS 223.65]
MALRASLLLLVATASVAAETLPINGWYPCSINTEATRPPKSSSSSSVLSLKASIGDDGRMWSVLLHPMRTTYIEALAAPKRATTVECATFTLPLCHAGLCTANASMPTIPVFVKRALASTRTTSTKALWFLQGGPGASSVNMESFMVLLYNVLGGAVDVYTMDHRGTGRSHRLTCAAAQIETSGSPTKGQITNSVLATCAQDVNVQLGAASLLRSFSTTSAAMDLSKVIASLGNDNTFVYGVSYGTYLVERLMQLENPSIKGYILDGVVSNSGSQTNQKMVFNDWDKNVDSVAQTFVELCTADAFCSAKFPGSDLKTTMTALYASLDAAPTKTQCASLLSSVQEGLTPSDLLRIVFSTLLQDQSLRPLIPALVYRIQRCNTNDALAVYNFLVQLTSSSSDDSDVLDSTMLYNLVVASELWRTPTESASALASAFKSTLIGSDVSDLAKMYCIASGGKDANCAGVTSKPYRLQYPTDKYFNQPIAIPAGASVLLMGGRLDPQTYYKYGSYQYDSFIGTAKRLVEFNYSAHGVVGNTPVTTKNEAPCGAQILGSFVRADGDLASLDTSCMAFVQPMTFQLASSDVQSLMATTDAYDGIPTQKFTQGITKSGGGSSSGSLGSNTASNTTSSGWKTAAILAFVLVGLLLLVIAYLLYRARVQAQKPPTYNEHIPDA